MNKPMVIFLVIFLAVYGGLNAYGFWKLRPLLGGRGAAQAALAVFVGLMTLGPILVRQLERADWTRTAYGLGLVVYVWMALILWFGVLTGLGDLWNLGVAGARHAWLGAARLSIPYRIEMAVISIILIMTLVWSFAAAWRQPRLERVTLRPPGWRGDPLRVLQISDVHLGLIERGRRLDQIARIVEQTRPDLIVSTGDLVDGSGDHLNTLHERLAALRPRLGKFAVTGNHEFYVGIGHSVRFHEAAGFRLLRGEAVDLDGGRLCLAGVDDPTVARMNGQRPKPETEAALLGPPRPGCATILLKHQPVVSPASAGRFDLMLSGHTHRGQIFPFGLLVRTFYRHLAGTYALDDGGMLHVSRGTGTWGPPLRLFSPPEVTLITIGGE